MLDNAEEVLQCLEEFSKIKQKLIPRELNDYLAYVAKTGDPVFKWALVKCLVREKLLNVITEFHEDMLTTELPPCPNVDPFNFERMKSSLLERLETFHGAPFTIQRLCELLINPKKEYTRGDKYMRAIEKNILVVSTREPGKLNESDCESNMNGILDSTEDLEPSFDSRDLITGHDASNNFESLNNDSITMSMRAVTDRLPSITNNTNINNITTIETTQADIKLTLFVEEPDSMENNLDNSDSDVQTVPVTGLDESNVYDNEAVMDTECGDLKLDDGTNDIITEMRETNCLDKDLECVSETVVEINVENNNGVVEINVENNNGVVELSAEVSIDSDETDDNEPTSINDGEEESNDEVSEMVTPGSEITDSSQIIVTNSNELEESIEKKAVSIECDTSEITESVIDNDITDKDNISNEDNLCVSDNEISTSIVTESENISNSNEDTENTVESSDNIEIISREASVIQETISAESTIDTEMEIDCANE